MYKGWGIQLWEKKVLMDMTTTISNHIHTLLSIGKLDGLLAPGMCNKSFPPTVFRHYLTGAFV